MTIYSADVRCPTKPNGPKFKDGRRADFDVKRAALQKALRDAYPFPVPVTRLCRLLVTVWLKTEQAGDMTGYICGLEDSISVGKVAATARRMATATHGFPVLADDSLVRSIGPAPGETWCLITGAGFDRVQFAVEELC